MKRHLSRRGIAHKSLLIFIVMAVVVSLGIISCAKKDSSEIVFAVDSTWPPMEFVNEDKEIVGFSIDMVNAIGEKEGFTPKFITTAWDGIFAGLLNGDYDAISSSVTITEERKEKMNFSDPYFAAGQALAMRVEDTQGINSLEELLAQKPGAKLGAQIGTQGAFLIEDYAAAELKTYDDLGPAVEELSNGTIDGIVADTPLIANYLLQSDTNKGKFAIVGEPMTNEEYGLVVKKGNDDLLDKLNSGLAKIKQDGTYDELVEKWTK